MKEWDNDKHEEALERRRQRRLEQYKYKYFSNYERCKGCPYYYGEIDECMLGELSNKLPKDTKTKCGKEVKDEA